jgi:hypothetical protein
MTDVLVVVTAEEVKKVAMMAPAAACVSAVG